MAEKVIHISRHVPAEIGEAFNEMTRRWCNPKQLGQSMAAAMLLFLEQPPEQQAAYIKRIRNRDLDATAQQLVEEARQRADQAAIKKRDGPDRKRTG